MDWLNFARGVTRLTKRMGARDRFRLSARWEIEVGEMAPDGTIRAVRERKKGPNLIVVAGLNAMKDWLFNAASAGATFQYLAIGTDLTPASSADVALGAEVARDVATYTAGGDGACTLDFTFAAGVGTGAISEAGIFDDAAAGNMVNHKVFDGAVSKGAGDALKASCIFTLAAA